MGSQLEFGVEFKLEQPVGKPELISIELIVFELVSVKQRLAELRPQLLLQQRQRALAPAGGRADRPALSVFTQAVIQRAGP